MKAREKMATTHEERMKDDVYAFIEKYYGSTVNHSGFDQALREFVATHAAQLQAERDTSQRDANELRGKLLRACSDADVVNADELCDWIVGAQSEIANLGGQLRDIWDMQSAYMRGEVPIDKITVGYVSEYEAETPLGQALDGMGDEVQE